MINSKKICVVLTLLQNLIVWKKLSEYHTGYRAFSRQVLETIPYQDNSNDFVFNNQFIVQATAGKFRIGEVSCPTKYFTEASSINFICSLKYGTGCMWVSFRYLLQQLGIIKYRLANLNLE